MNKKQYRLVLETIGVEVEDEFDLDNYFNVVDRDADGFVNYDDFETNLLDPGAFEGELTLEDFITVEKLSEF